MKTTSATVVLLAFLILAGMIVSPVSAYTEYTSWSISGTNTSAYGITNRVMYANISNAPYITKIEWSGKGYQTNATTGANNNNAFTGNIRCDLDGTIVGTYAAQVHYTSNTSGDWADMSVELLTNVNSNGPATCGKTGFNSFYLGSSTVGADYYFNKKIAPTNYAMQNLVIHDHDITWASGSDYAAFLQLGGTTPNLFVPVGSHATYYGSAVVVPAASFSCSPTSQYPDESVVCTDTSSNAPTSWYWTIDALNWGQDAWQTSTSQNFTWESHYPGIFSVNLQATNSAGSDWENKSSYVSISANATPNTCDAEPAYGYSRTRFRCMNPSNDATVFGCNIQLNDVEGSAWSNQTNIADGIWCIDTLPLHHINAYADATGYTSGSRIGVDEWNHMQYTIPLIPGYVPPATSGYVWVYVYVTDWATQTPLSGVTVSLSGNGLSTQTGTTGSSGSVALQWKNLTTAYINVAKAGYTTGSKTLTTSSFGPDITYIAIHQGIYTATLTPIGTAVTTIGPYGTPGPLGTMPAGYTNTQGQVMMDFLARNGLSLVELCFFVTILALLGVKLGK